MPGTPREPFPSTRHRTGLAAWLVLLGLLGLAGSAAADDELRLLVARSANESGVVTRLVDVYEAANPGRQIKVIGAGSLDVLERARGGGADAVISHAPQSEQLFMADGYGVSRTLFMYNQFAIFGPPDDPLGLRLKTDLIGALTAIAEAEPPFLVQGSRSGTQLRLLQLWAAANIRPDWLGYETTGGGSPATLATAAEFGAYAFADLASYFALPAERRTQIAPLVRDHRALRNDYHYLIVNPDKVPGAQPDLAADFLAFLVSDRGQQLIGQFGSDHSPVPLYVPAAHLDQRLQKRYVSRQLAGQRTQLYLLTAAVALAVTLTVIAGFIYRRARDVTRATVQHAERLERAAEASQEGLFDWDLVAGTLYCTRPTLGLLDLADSDARNLHALLRQALDNNQAGRVSAALQNHLNEPDGVPFSIELNAAGRRLELRGQVSRDDAGTPLRMAGSLRTVNATANTAPDPISDSLHDRLTGLPGRRLLGDRLQQAIQQCSRHHTVCLVLVVSLNGVRTAGTLSESPPDDGVVRAVAARLRQLLRGSDTLARLDDDNFVAVLSTADNQHGKLALEKLLAGLQRPFHVEHQSLHVDSTIGCAIYPDHGQQHHSLLHRAQLAMLQAARDGQPMGVYRPQSRDSDDLVAAGDRPQA